MTSTDLLNRVLDAAGAGNTDAPLGPLPPAPPEGDLLDCLDEIRAMVVRDLDGALRALDVVAGLVDSIDSATARARLGSVRGHALNYATRYDEAEEAATGAVEAAESIGDETEAARAWMVLVHTYAKLGRLGDALRSALEAERAFTEGGELGLAVQALCNAGIVTRMMGDGEAAIGMFERALGMQEHEPAIRAQIESGLAESMLDVGRFADAEAAFLRSARTFESVGASRAASIVRGNLADLYGRQGRLSAAIEQFEVARRFFEEDRAYGELGRILTEQADVYAATGLIDDAIAGYRRAGGLLERAGAVQEQARSLTGLGRMLITRDPDEAADAFDRAAALYEQAGSTSGRALATLHRARLELARGDPEAAERAVDAATDALAGRRSDLLMCEMTRADVLIARGDFARAETLLTEAMDTAATLGLPIYRAEMLWRRSVARRGAGRIEHAIADAREAIDQIERIRGTLQGSRFRAGLVGGSRALYEQAVSLMLETGATVEAFETTERARGRTLLDLLGGGAEIDAAAGAEDDATRNLLRDLADARADLNAVYSALDPTASGPSHAQWIEKVRGAEDRVTAIETRLHASRRVRELLGVPESFGRIAAELDPGQALVSYWIDGESMRCFVVRDGRAEAATLPASTDEIGAAIQDALFQIRRGLMRGPEGASRQRRLSSCLAALSDLHDMIWAPLAGMLEGVEQAAVVPAGPLHAVPFSALYDGRCYLVERVEPVLLPTAGVLPLLHNTGTDAPGNIAVLAVPDRIAPEIEMEASALRDTLPDADVIVGPEATSERARQMAASAGVLHLACHGAFPPSNPLAAGLKLADRWITVRDVLSWKLPGSVVVLSGCDTGRNALRAGEELFGFSRGFLAAGARALIVSLWTAHDATTRRLMTDMYRACGTEEGPHAMRSALGKAQYLQIQAGVHPAFWSNFIYLGA